MTENERMLSLVASITTMNPSADSQSNLSTAVFQPTAQAHTKSPVEPSAAKTLAKQAPPTSSQGTHHSSSGGGGSNHGQNHGNHGNHHHQGHQQSNSSLTNSSRAEHNSNKNDTSDKAHQASLTTVAKPPNPATEEIDLITQISECLSWPFSSSSRIMC